MVTLRIIDSITITTATTVIIIIMEPPRTTEIAIFEMISHQIIRIIENRKTIEIFVEDIHRCHPKEQARLEIRTIVRTNLLLKNLKLAGNLNMTPKRRMTKTTGIMPWTAETMTRGNVARIHHPSLRRMTVMIVDVVVDVAINDEMVMTMITVLMMMMMMMTVAVVVADIAVPPPTTAAANAVVVSAIVKVAVAVAANVKVV